MAIYFFSDVHLGENNSSNDKRKLEKLLPFFDLIEKNGDKLYILGDLFDFWFEYKHAIPKVHLKVISRISHLIESGIEVNYISGNHDFWLGDYLEKEAGIRIHRDDLIVTEQGKKLFLTHGDGISPSDKGYRILKKILRNRFNIWLYQKLPVDWGIPLAKAVAGSSREHTSGRCLKFLEDYRKFAQDKLLEGYDAVMIGHLHKPILEELDGGIYMNTGDFIEHFSYIKMTDGCFSLEYL